MSADTGLSIGISIRVELRTRLVTAVGLAAFIRPICLASISVFYANMQSIIFSKDSNKFWMTIQVIFESICGFSIFNMIRQFIPVFCDSICQGISFILCN